MKLFKSISNAASAVIDKGSEAIVDSLDVVTDITGVLKTNTNVALEEAKIEGNTDLAKVHAEAHSTIATLYQEHATAFKEEKDEDGNVTGYSVNPLPVFKFG